MATRKKRYPLASAWSELENKCQGLERQLAIQTQVARELGASVDKYKEGMAKLADDNIRLEKILAKGDVAKLMKLSEENDKLRADYARVQGSLRNELQKQKELEKVDALKREICELKKSLKDVEARGNHQEWARGITDKRMAALKAKYNELVLKHNEQANESMFQRVREENRELRDWAKKARFAAVLEDLDRAFNTPSVEIDAAAILTW